MPRSRAGTAHRALNVRNTPSIHAECRLVRHLNPRSKRPYDLHVWRHLGDGSPAMARPCMHCLKVLRKFPIRHVYYTDEHGGVTRERLDSMSSAFVSSSRR